MEERAEEGEEEELKGTQPLPHDKRGEGVQEMRMKRERRGHW